MCHVIFGTANNGIFFLFQFIEVVHNNNIKYYKVPVVIYFNIQRQISIETDKELSVLFCLIQMLDKNEAPIIYLVILSLITFDGHKIHTRHMHNHK